MSVLIVSPEVIQHPYIAQKTTGLVESLLIKYIEIYATWFIEIFFNNTIKVYYIISYINMFVNFKFTKPCKKFAPLPIKASPKKIKRGITVFVGMYYPELHQPSPAVGNNYKN